MRRQKCAVANICKASRRKTKEEVVQGQGYANSILHPPRAPNTTTNDYRNAHTHIPNERNERPRHEPGPALT
jgi:hypothetical protein